MTDKNIPAERLIKCVIFDLDGTLVNTIRDLGLACEYVLKQSGIESKWTEADYKRFVGNGAKLLIERIFEGNLSENELEMQYKLFKEKYNEIKLDNAYIYEGMKSVVKSLKINGIKLAVCTNKPDIAANDMVETLFGKDTFDVICGAIDGIPKKPDSAMPKMILERLNVKANECIWVGDSSVDIESAQNLGCKSIAVTWGFRSFESLFKAYPSLIIDSPYDILKIFNLHIDNC